MDKRKTKKHKPITIVIKADTKAAIDSLKVIPRESYNDVLKRIIGYAPLTQKTEGTHERKENNE